MDAIYIQLLVSGLLLGGIYALVSMGLTLVFGVMGVTNFAHGEFLMLGLYGTFWLTTLYGLHPYATMLVTVPLLFVLGVVVQRTLIMPTVGKPPVIHVFVTLGLSVVLQNIALLLWSADFRTVTTPIAGTAISIGGVSIGLAKIVVMGVTLLVAAGMHLFLQWTWLGKAIRATSQDRSTAMLMGINFRQIYALTFGIGVACLGVAGALLMPIYYVYPAVGFQFVLVAFVAVVMGGMGSVKGAIIASILIGFIETLSGFFIAPSVKQAVYFGLFILVLVVRPQGLFGERVKVV